MNAHRHPERPAPVLPRVLHPRAHAESRFAPAAAHVGPSEDCVVELAIRARIKKFSIRHPMLLQFSIVAHQSTTITTLIVTHCGFVSCAVYCIQHNKPYSVYGMTYTVCNSYTRHYLIYLYFFDYFVCFTNYNVHSITYQP